MPALEQTDRMQRALLWKLNGVDRQRNPVVRSPSSIRVRVVEGSNRVQDANGDSINLDATAILGNVDAPMGSILRPNQGDVADYYFLDHTNLGADSSYGNDGIVEGSITQVPNLYGVWPGAQFDGISGQIAISGPNLRNISGRDFQLDFYLRVDNGTNANIVLAKALDFENGVYEWAVGVGETPGSTVVVFWNGGAQSFAASNFGPLAIGTVYRVLIQYSYVNSTMTIAVNGVSNVLTGVVPVTSTPGNLYIGGDGESIFAAVTLAKLEVSRFLASELVPYGEFMQVKAVTTTGDIKNRNKRRTVGLMRYNDAQALTVMAG